MVDDGEENGVTSSLCALAFFDEVFSNGCRMLWICCLR